MTHEELINRAKELQELDSNPDIATYQDIDNLPKGRVIVPWGPGSGKSTAIRNWIAKHWSSYCIYATKTISEATSFYNDLMAMKEAGLLNNLCKVSLFYSGLGYKTNELQSSNVIICTHERLLIEPPKILYRNGLDEDVLWFDKDVSLFRTHVFVDELPDGFKKFKITQELLLTYSNLYNFIKSSSTSDKPDEINKVLTLKRFYSSAYDELAGLPARLTLSESATAQSLVSHFESMNLSLRPKKNHKKDVVERAIYFSMLILNKLLKMMDESKLSGIELNNYLIGKYIYYSILDIPESVDNIYVFDGTGDISMRNSSFWTIAKCDKFSRILKADSFPDIIPESDLIRNEKSKDDHDINQQSITNIINYVSELLDNNSKSKVLIYAWKSISLIDETDADSSEDEEFLLTEDFTSSILSAFSSDLYKDRVSVIYYQSGKDKGTSEFADYTDIVILGKFNIPGLALNLISKVRGSVVNAETYRAALIIQAIARTRLRVGKSIKIHFNSDYNIKDIRRILCNYSKCYVNNELIDPKSFITEDDLVSMSSSESQKLLMRYLHQNYAADLLSGSPIELLSTEIAEICNCRSDHVNRVLSRCDGLIYEYVRGTSKTNPSKYKIRLPELSLF